MIELRDYVAPALLDPQRPLVVLSHGMGQDSSALHGLLTDPLRPDLRGRYVGDAQLLVIHADTGAEYAATIAHREWVCAYTRQSGDTYFQVDRHLGFHGGAWKDGLHGQWDAHGTIGSVAFGSSCSDQLKITPIWRAINALLAASYDVDPAGRGGIKEHHRRFNRRIVCHIGFSRGEERRVRAPQAQCAMELFKLPKKRREEPLWFTDNVMRQYPLIDVGFDRAQAQAYLRSRNHPVCRPSLCRTCHWQDEAAVLHLARTEPDTFAYWVGAETRKRTGKPGTGRNYGVKGVLTLPQFLDRAIRMLGHLTTDQLFERVLNHSKVQSQA